jgi:hypothetical protein
MIPKHQRFCDLYVSQDFFGNGVEAYAAAYNIDLTNPRGYYSARTGASKLLTKVNLCLYITEQLDAAGLNDNFVDKQLLLAITQNADFGSKVAAIKEYNKLKARIVERAELTVRSYKVTLNLNG